MKNINAQKFKYLFKIILMVFLALAFMTSCSLLRRNQIGADEATNEAADKSENTAEEHENWPVELLAEDGKNTISITQKPQRVLSLSPALTELSFFFGYGDRLIGVSDFCDYPEQAKQLEAVGVVSELDIAAVLEMRPDYIIAQEQLLEAEKELLSFQDIKIIVISPAITLLDIPIMYEKLFLFYAGKYDGQRLADEYNTNFKNEMQSINDKIPDDNKLKGLYLYGHADIAATSDFFEGELLDIIKIDNLAKNNTNLSYDFSNDEMKNADVLINASTVAVENFIKSDILENIKAYKNEKIINVNSIPIERKSPRMLDEIKKLAENIYSIDIE